MQAIYTRLFDWLITKVNACMVMMAADGAPHSDGTLATTGDGGDRLDEESSVEGGGAAFIGLLDVFGFECFEHNSFEQVGSSPTRARPCGRLGFDEGGACRHVPSAQDGSSTSRLCMLSV